MVVLPDWVGEKCLGQRGVEPHTVHFGLPGASLVRRRRALSRQRTVFRHGVEPRRDLVPQQGEHQLGTFAQRRLGQLVAERATAVPAQVIGEPVGKVRFADVGGQRRQRMGGFSVLRTVEDMYGLPHAGAAEQATPITDAWTG